MGVVMVEPVILMPVVGPEGIQAMVVAGEIMVKLAQ
jgi:hypothetical protein